MRISRAIAIAALVLGGGLAFSISAQAADGPTVAWNSPANNSTVTGVIALKATAAPSATGTSTINQWCLTVNGEETNDYLAANFYVQNQNGDYRGDYFNRSNGCWTSSSYDSRKLTLSYDTTKWENASYTFVVKVTDSNGRESDVSKVTITTNNPGPTITGTSDSGDSQNWPSVSLVAKPTPGFEVTTWCLNQQTDSNIDVFPVFTDSNGEELDEDSYEYSDGCYTPNYESRQVKFSLVPSNAKNGKYAFEFWAYDENNHSSEKYKYEYTVQDPGLKIGLPDSGTLYLPGDFPNVELNSQGGYRTVESIQWSIDGKAIPGSGQQLNANLSEVSPGAHTVSVKVIDSVGQSYSASKSYTMKWAPELKFVGLEGAYWWIPATPTIKVKAYLGDSEWAGSHKATISYRNSSGKAVKQTFTIKNGVGSVVLQTLKSTTSIEVSVEATKGTVAASVEATVELKKKPPAPVTTNVSLRIPKLVIWPNSFNATLKVSGKGRYECSIRFQNFVTSFYLNSGSSKTVVVQPTEGLNKVLLVYGACWNSRSTGWDSNSIVLSLQR